MLGTTLVVLVIAQAPGDPLTLAFERAARRVLGNAAEIRLESVAEDPPDDESVARAGTADGVVELSLNPEGTKARIHCYVSREARWVDREISFGAAAAGADREASERGRLLGFAVATMFAHDAEPAPSTVSAPSPQASAKKAEAPAPQDQAPPTTDSRRATGSKRRYSLEFGGTVSSGINGTASGLGATAALRLSWLGPIWPRLFVSGRAGNIPRALATTSSMLLGGGLAFAALSEKTPWELGARTEVFVSYFEASHLSEDDADADRRSRWLPGGDLIAEGGFRFARSAGLFMGCGIEAVLGRTDVYTHGQRVAVVPPLRLVGELGFRTRF